MEHYYSVKIIFMHLEDFIKVPLGEVLGIEFLHIDSAENGAFLKVFPILISENLMALQRSREH